MYNDRLQSFQAANSTLFSPNSSNNATYIPEVFEEKDWFWPPIYLYMPNAYHFQTLIQKKTASKIVIPKPILMLNDSKWKINRSQLEEIFRNQRITFIK